MNSLSQDLLPLSSVPLPTMTSDLLKPALSSAPGEGSQEATKGVLSLPGLLLMKLLCRDDRNKRELIVS